jgi:hypothetical protein
MGDGCHVLGVVGAVLVPREFLLEDFHPHPWASKRSGPSIRPPKGGRQVTTGDAG